MNKKIFGVLVFALLIICGISYSGTAINFNINSQSYDEKTLTNTDDPLTIRTEVKQIGYRI
jgi:hypothetical protein